MKKILLTIQLIIVILTTVHSFGGLRETLLLNDAFKALKPSSQARLKTSILTPNTPSIFIDDLDTCKSKITYITMSFAPEKKVFKSLFILYGEGSLMGFSPQKLKNSKLSVILKELIKKIWKLYEISKKNSDIEERKEYLKETEVPFKIKIRKKTIQVPPHIKYII